MTELQGWIIIGLLVLLFFGIQNLSWHPRNLRAQLAAFADRTADQLQELKEQD